MSDRRSGNINVVGLFSDPAFAGRATYDLVAKGFPGRGLSVISSIPYPVEAFATDHRPSRVHHFSAVGAVVGLSAGLVVAIGTALAYPLPTGGKPVVAWPTIGVITYEFTMLGAILLTLLGLLFLARLPRRRPAHYDLRVADGSVAVLVPCPNEERATQAEELLAAHGAQEVTRRNGA